MGIDIDKARDGLVTDLSAALGTASADGYIFGWKTAIETFETLATKLPDSIPPGQGMTVADAMDIVLRAMRAVPLDAAKLGGLMAKTTLAALTPPGKIE
jgi:hypothetical protein